MAVPCCGNPPPSGLDEPCQHPEQRPLCGQVVQGRYIPFRAAALDRSLRRPGQSRALGSPGEGRRQGSLKDRAWDHLGRGGGRGALRTGHAADEEEAELEAVAVRDV